MLEKVPKLRRLPVFGFFLREYKRYSPDFNLRIIILTTTFYFLTVLLFMMIASRQRVAFPPALFGAKLYSSDHPITRDRLWTGPFDSLQIGVQFESIEIGGKKVPLSAILYPPPRAMFIEANRMRFLKADDSFIGGTFFFNDTHVRPKQLDSEWITVAPDEEKDKNNWRYRNSAMTLVRPPTRHNFRLCIEVHTVLAQGVQIAKK